MKAFTFQAPPNILFEATRIAQRRNSGARLVCTENPIRVYRMIESAKLAR
jgi:hypothetical protein